MDEQTTRLQKAILEIFDLANEAKNKFNAGDYKEADQILNAIKRSTKGYFHDYKWT